MCSHKLNTNKFLIKINEESKKMVGGIGKSKALANRWIKLDKSTGIPCYNRSVEEVEDNVQKQLLMIEKGLLCISYFNALSIFSVFYCSNILMNRIQT